MRQPAEDEGLPAAAAHGEPPAEGSDGTAVPHGLTIRRQTLADVPAVHRVRFAGWQAAYHGIVPADFLADLAPTPASIARSEEMFSQRGPQVHSFVAVRTVTSGSRSRPGAIDDVIGFVVAGPDRDVGPPAGEIWAIYVDPAFWGGGVGRLLLATGVDVLRGAGRDPIILWVLEQNHRARGFYEHEGFVPTGERRDIDLGAPLPEVKYELRGRR